jgi:flagellar basal-body rod protein FlgC
MMMILLSAMNVSASGMSAHAQRAQIHAVNIANLGTPNYKRQIPILHQQAGMPFHEMLQQVHAAGAGMDITTYSDSGVAMLGTAQDPTPGKKLYMPYHPDADEQGYVEASTANPLVDMADAVMANRMYEASLSAYGILKTMASRAVQIGSGR